MSNSLEAILAAEVTRDAARDRDVAVALDAWGIAPPVDLDELTYQALCELNGQKKLPTASEVGEQCGRQETSTRRALKRLVVSGRVKEVFGKCSRWVAVKNS